MQTVVFLGQMSGWAGLSSTQGLLNMINAAFLMPPVGCFCVRGAALPISIFPLLWNLMGSSLGLFPIIPPRFTGIHPEFIAQPSSTQPSAKTRTHDLHRGNKSNGACLLFDMLMNENQDEMCVQKKKPRPPWMVTVQNYKIHLLPNLKSWETVFFSSRFLHRSL